MKRLLLVPVFGLAVSALAAPAHAQLGGLLDGDRLNYSAEARQPYYEARRIAYDNGYREGLQEGEKDGRRQRSVRVPRRGRLAQWRQGLQPELRRSRALSCDVPRRLRSRLQRRVSALRASLRLWQRPRDSAHTATVFDVSELPEPSARRVLPRSARIRIRSAYGSSPAFTNGSRDGYEKGREDVGDRDPYDPARHSWYRSGDRNYRNEYGSRERYRDEYRQGFQEGYDRAFREYGYRR